MRPRGAKPELVCVLGSGRPLRGHEGLLLFLARLCPQGLWSVRHLQTASLYQSRLRLRDWVAGETGTRELLGKAKISSSSGVLNGIELAELVLQRRSQSASWLHTRGAKAVSVVGSSAEDSTSSSRLPVRDRHYQEAVRALLQICWFLFKTLLCSG